MAYATETDIVTLYGPNLLTVIADRDNDNIVDSDAVARSLEEASEEIDSYVGVKYAVPLSTSLASIRRCAVDIAVYRLAQTADVLTDELRQRYEDCIKLLLQISKGTATLNIAQPGTDGASVIGDQILGEAMRG